MGTYSHCDMPSHQLGMATCPHPLVSPHSLPASRSDGGGGLGSGEVSTADTHLLSNGRWLGW